MRVPKVEMRHRRRRVLFRSLPVFHFGICILSTVIQLVAVLDMPADGLGFSAVRQHEDSQHGGRGHEAAECGQYAPPTLGDQRFDQKEEYGKRQRNLIS